MIDSVIWEWYNIKTLIIMTFFIFLKGSDYGT